MHSLVKATAITLPLLIIVGCKTTPEPEPEIVVITPPAIVQTCYPLAALKKNVTPAVIKRGFSIVSIDSPSQYYTDPETGKTVEIKTPSIETKTPYTKVVTPEVIYYTTPEGDVITDICELNKASDAVDAIKDPAPAQ